MELIKYIKSSIKANNDKKLNSILIKKQNDINKSIDKVSKSIQINYSKKLLIESLSYINKLDNFKHIIISNDLNLIIELSNGIVKDYNRYINNVNQKKLEDLEDHLYSNVFTISSDFNSYTKRYIQLLVNDKLVNELDSFQKYIKEFESLFVKEK